MQNLQSDLTASVVWDPKVYNKEIEPLIIEYQKQFLSKLEEFIPVQVSIIHEKFLEFREEIYPSLLKFYAEKFGAIDELDCILEKRILVLGELQNCRRLQALSEKNIAAFLENYNLSVRMDPSELSLLIVDGVIHNDDILTDQVANTKAVSKANQGRIKTPGDFNQSVIICLNLIQQYLKSLFDKYELAEYYSCKKHSIELYLYTELREKCTKEFKAHYTTIKKAMEKHYNGFLQHIEALRESVINVAPENNTIAYWRSVYKVIKKVEPKAFTDNVINELNFAPSEIFLSEYTEKLKTETEFIVNKVFELRDDFEHLLIFMGEPLKALFKEYYITKEFDLFDKKFFNESELVAIVEILVFTDLGINEQVLWENFCVKKLESLVADWIIPKLNPFFADYVQSLLKMLEKGGGHLAIERTKFDEELKISVEKWNELNKAKNNELFLPTLFSIFIYFSNSLRDSEGQRYRSYYRKIITRVFRNLSNLEQKFSNHQLLTLMECYYQEFNPSLENAGDKTKLEEKQVVFRNRLAELAKQKNTLESILMLENVLCLENCISDAEIPSKFYIERINKDPTIKSKHIIVSVSGWTSELMKKSSYWNELVDANPFTEIHAVHYESQHEKRISSTVFEKIASAAVSAFDRREWLSDLGIYGKILSIGLTVYDGYVKYREVISETWEKAFKEAVTTGTYLAHILQQADYYKDKTITLVGFSLGTMVVACCLWELERLKCYDRLYDVVIIGGVVNTGDFMNSSLKPIACDLINCYSRNDSVLKYILRAADITSDPVGLSEIVTTAKNVKNYDFTEMVSGHFDYRPKMKSVLRRINFNEDINYIFDV